MSIGSPKENEWNIIIDWLIDWIEFYAVSEIFQACNVGDYQLNSQGLSPFWAQGVWYHKPVLGPRCMIPYMVSYTLDPKRD